MLNTLLDRSIVFSFDRTGFQRHANHFTPMVARDLQDRHTLVTGGSRGIGLAAAADLAGFGARPILWARDRTRGTAAAAEIDGTFTSVDLGDLEAVADAARGITTPLAAVVLNAGSMPRTLTHTRQGHELMWASQVLGHLLLLRILRHRGMLAEDCRVLWVASGGLYAARLGEKPATYQRHQWYAAAKRAQVTLVARLAARWPELWMGAMHPGWVDTEAVQYSMPWFHLATRPILRDHAQGADTITWAIATSPAPQTGRFWFDRETAPLHLREATRTTDTAEEALENEVFAATEPNL